MNAVDIANAALMEVGLEPIAVEWFDPVTKRPGITMPFAGRSATHHRAALLGVMATRGPDHMTRCLLCYRDGINRGLPPCIPVRDALRGLTCGAS